MTSKVSYYLRITCLCPYVIIVLLFGKSLHETLLYNLFTVYVCDSIHFLFGECLGPPEVDNGKALCPLGG